MTDEHKSVVNAKQLITADLQVERKRGERRQQMGRELEGRMRQLQEVNQMQKDVIS